MKILAFTYGHPEAHGALISSILSISENANNVDFYYKNNYKITFKFPDNVTFIPNSFKIIPEDKFFNTFASLTQFSPFLPLIGGGKTKFAPIYVGDVAKAIVKVLELNNSVPKIYELGGPKNYFFLKTSNEKT